MRPIRRDSLPVLVAEEIRRDIVQGVFQPQDKLPSENVLGRELGVGRPTIREALRILEGQSWIKIKFGGGAYVMDGSKVSHKTASYFRKIELFELLEHEIKQLQEEGRNISNKEKEKLDKLKENATYGEIEEFYNSLQKLGSRAEFPYSEPNELNTIIKEAHPEGLSFLSRIPSKDVLYERIHGAWLGRCVGCLLGKPVEGWSKKEIEEYLKATDSYPLEDYFPYRPDAIAMNGNSFHPSARTATKGNIHFMPRDDDLDYTILNLKIMKESEFKFSTEDVGEAWLLNLPYKMLYTAERRTYVNLVGGLKPTETATNWNPFREWIGAQIRADAFGYLAPANPEIAASLAYKDARLSHTKNGIYGAMFIAAAISTALVSDNLSEVIDAGLSQVPQESRLAEVVKNIIMWNKNHSTWQEAWQEVTQHYGGYHWVHTLPNLANVLIGLLWGELDFCKTISIAVMCGLDTDCNGATAGSILGAIKGVGAIPEHMIAPLNDRIKSVVLDYSDVKINDLAKETFALLQQIHKKVYP